MLLSEEETPHTTTVMGHALHYRTVGAGTPLVLIHGFGVSGRIWQRMLPLLAQEYQVFSIDLPGYGRSKVAGAWRLREMAPLLAAWLHRLQISSAIVMGQSMGGAIAIHLAAYAPELVRQLVLIDAIGLPLQEPMPKMAARALHSFLQRGNGSYPLALLKDVLQPRLRLSWQVAGEIMQSDFRTELAAVTMPTLIVWGERDVLLPIVSGNALYAALPHAQFVTLPDCGHRPMLTQPALLSRIVCAFLRESMS